jgi:hypothetical protein
MNRRYASTIVCFLAFCAATLCYLSINRQTKTISGNDREDLKIATVKPSSLDNARSHQSKGFNQEKSVDAVHPANEQMAHSKTMWTKNHLNREENKKSKMFFDTQDQDFVATTSSSDLSTNTFYSPLDAEHAATSDAPKISPTPKKSLSQSTPSQAREIVVEVPTGADVPMVLVEVKEEDGFTTSDLSRINLEADRFVVQATRNGTQLKPEPGLWQEAQQQSDELFRTWYGVDAYMAMQERRYFESRISDNP